jgi:hypothetical protein
MHRVNTLLTWLVLVLLVGGHWGALQVVAWTGMVVDYSRDASLCEAVKKTFDGLHPCALCLELREDGDGADGDPAPVRKAPGKPLKVDAVIGTLLPVSTAQVPLGQFAVAGMAPLIGVTSEPLRRPPRSVG